MAANPGFLTDWPWTPLGSFKYVVLAPWVVHSFYSFLINKEENERNYFSLVILPLLLWRVIHSLIWISISRHRTAKGNNRIVDKTIEFDQVDRESNWDDPIILSGLIMYFLSMIMPKYSCNPPWWRTDGILITVLLHMGPVEFLYYWLHRALHHHYIYTRYHSHHHSSIVTQPITSVIHPFGEQIAYHLIFAIPTLTTMYTGTISIVSFTGYITYFDFMNNMGHCNFEFIPKWIFSLFPPLKYLMYTPSFHSLHHTQFRTNYSAFMPIYDYMFGTWDKSSDKLHETSLRKQEDTPDVVHLTHLTNPESIYHIRLIGFSSFASLPENYYPTGRRRPYIFLLLWPVTFFSSYIFGRMTTFVLERNTLLHDHKLIKMQVWAVPKYKVQYLIKREKEVINGFIEKAILDAESKGTKVLSLGLLNQDVKLNNSGEVLIRRNPKLKIKVVDGSSLAVAIVVNTIPKETNQVLFICNNNLTKVAFSIASALCQMGIQVVVSNEGDFKKLKLKMTSQISNLVLANNFSHHKIWVVGDGLTKEQQMKAKKDTIFIPFSQLPLKKLRKDCSYHHTPAMEAPSSFQNVDSCENWLPRRAISASRIAGILHALEDWKVNECGDSIFDTDTIWKSSLKYGFRPLNLSYLPQT